MREILDFIGLTDLHIRYQKNIAKVRYEMKRGCIISQLDIQNIDVIH